MLDIGGCRTLQHTAHLAHDDGCKQRPQQKGQRQDQHDQGHLADVNAQVAPIQEFRNKVAE